LNAVRALHPSAAFAATTASRASFRDPRGTFTTAGLGTFNHVGGTVTLDGTLVNTGSTLTLNATTGSWLLNAGTIRGGTVTTSGGAQLILPVGDNGTLDGVTLDTSLTISNNYTLYVTTNGVVLNSTTITLTSNAVATVTSATVNHDNTPNILEACASSAMNTIGGTIFVPTSNPEGSLYVVNSPLNMATGCPSNTRLQLGAQLLGYAGHDLEAGGAARTRGVALPLVHAIKRRRGRSMGCASAQKQTQGDQEKPP